MLIALIVEAAQVLYWFAVTTDWAMEYILCALPLENYLPIYLLRPFSALLGAAPWVYVVLQCVLLVAVFVFALFILFSKKFAKGAKICTGINLIGIILLFCIPFEFSAILNLCSSIPLLCFVIHDYRANESM